MATWQNLNENEVRRRIPAHPSEHTPWTEDERHLGLRIFRRPGQKTCAEDLESGLIGIGRNGGEALTDLRGKVAKVSEE